MLSFKKVIVGLCVLCGIFGINVSAFGPTSPNITHTTYCSTTDRGIKDNGSASTLFALSSFQIAYFSTIPGVDLNKTITGEPSWQKNDYANATIDKCETNLDSGKRDTDEYSRRSAFWSFSAPAYQSFFSSSPNYNASKILPSDVGNLQSYIKRACGIQSDRLADGKVGIHTLNAARICTPPCKGLCGWELFSRHVDKGSIRLIDGGLAFDGGEYKGNPTESNICFDVTLDKSKYDASKFDGDFEPNNVGEARLLQGKNKFEQKYGLVVCEDKKVKCGNTLTQAQYDVLLGNGLKEESGSCCFPAATATGTIKTNNPTIIEGFWNTVKSCETKKCANIPWIAELDLSSYTTIAGVLSGGSSCCYNSTTFSSPWSSGANNTAIYSGITSNSLSLCSAAPSPTPTADTCPFNVPADAIPNNKEEYTDAIKEESKNGQSPDSCSCKKGYTKKNVVFTTKDKIQQTYSVCEACNKEKCNCGIKLNTNVPFIGRCIMYGDTNQTNDAQYTNGDDSTIVVNSLNAFPVLMGGLVKILMTAIILICFGSLIVAGVMMTVPGQYDDGKKLIMKVVYAIAATGAAGTILYLVNPNFFA